MKVKLIKRLHEIMLEIVKADDEELTKMNGETNELEHFEDVDDYNKFKDIFYERKGVK